MKKFKPPAHLQRFVSIQDPITNFFHLPSNEMTSADFRKLSSAAKTYRNVIAGVTTPSKPRRGSFLPSEVIFTKHQGLSARL